MDEPNLSALLAVTRHHNAPSTLYLQSNPVNTIEATAFIPALPLHVVLTIVEAKAEKALPLVLAIHRQLHMAKRETTPLNAAIWKAAGSPSTRERESIIRKLKALPGLVYVEKDRTTTSHYRVGRGSDWGAQKSR
eukprot:gene13287-13397_t